MLYMYMCHTNAPMKHTIVEFGICHADQPNRSDVVLVLHGNARGKLTPSEARALLDVDHRVGPSCLLLSTVQSRERRILVHLKYLSLLRACLGRARQYLELRTNSSSIAVVERQAAFLLLFQ